MSSPSPIIHPLAAPNLSEADIAAAVRVLRSGALVQGPEVRLFESRCEEFTGATHAIAVANGTVAIQLALTAAGIVPDDEVIVPAFSFIATANAVVLGGATPVFVDVDARTFNLNPALIGAAITPRTKAILPVHEFGLCCEIDAILTIATQHHLTVIEDAACALGSRHRGKHAGTFGALGTFSLHPRKIITCGEGGVITTSSAILAERLRTLRNHGAAVPPHAPGFVAAGHNARLTDFQAALVASQMLRLETSLRHRRELADFYFQHIRHSGVTLPLVPADKQPNWQTFHLLLADDISQSDAIARLRTQGIGTNLGAQCLPAQEYYRARQNDSCREQFPNAWRVWRQGLAIPLHDTITLADAAKIADAINQLPSL